MTDVFQRGDAGSALKWSLVVEQLASQGQQILQDLDLRWLESFLALDRRLSSINGYRHRASRVATHGVAGKFIVGDFTDIDQAKSTALVRADASAVTLPERSFPAEAQIRQVRFRSSAGTVERIGDVYQVRSAEEIPTGIFDIELADVVQGSLLLLDLILAPSDPGITVEVSENGVRFTAAESLSRNGYRVAAYLQSQAVRFVRVTVLPTHADTAGGLLYSFGITDFHVFLVEFHLRAELQMKPILLAPHASKLLFSAASTTGLRYFLALAGGDYQEMFSGSQVSVPGAVDVDVQASLDGTGLLQHTLPADVYLRTLEIRDPTTQARISVAPGLSEAAIGLTNQYVVVDGSNLNLRPYSGADAGRLFDISYTRGPAQIDAQLRVELISSLRSKTPVFSGASLEEL